VTYALQVTPLVSIQPDLQVIWDPANNPAAQAVTFQLQLNAAW
jgi:carbohydrate-selective porin OprB